MSVARFASIAAHMLFATVAAVIVLLASILAGLFALVCAPPLRRLAG